MSHNQKTTEAFEASDEITNAVLREVQNRMANREPVSPNTIWRCLQWAGTRIEELETGIIQTKEHAERLLHG